MVDVKTSVMCCWVLALFVWSISWYILPIIFDARYNLSGLPDNTTPSSMWFLHNLMDFTVEANALMCSCWFVPCQRLMWTRGCSDWHVSSTIMLTESRFISLFMCEPVICIVDCWLPVSCLHICTLFWNCKCFIYGMCCIALGHR